MSNTTIEDFIFEVLSGTKDRDSFYGWKRRKVLPRADEALKIAKAMGTTVEELIDGEGGAEYLKRYQTMGYYKDVLFVVYTERDDSTRIISARIAEPFERRIYANSKILPGGWERVNP